MASCRNEALDNADAYPTPTVRNASGESTACADVRILRALECLYQDVDAAGFTSRAWFAANCTNRLSSGSPSDSLTLDRFRAVMNAAQGH
ncbi:hypothetical protein E4U58_003544 [Claviceps cyperi]|nr:hypothetical protein E4U58_003544 [Claviceps cyperi]